MKLIGHERIIVRMFQWLSLLRMAKMKYQLVYHDGSTPTFVAQSDELSDDNAKNAWYQSTVPGKTKPDDQLWAIVDQNHAWYKQESKDQPVTPDLMEETKELWLRQRLQAIEEREAMSELMRTVRKKRKPVPMK